MPTKFHESNEKLNIEVNRYIFLKRTLQSLPTKLQKFPPSAAFGSFDSPVVTGIVAPPETMSKEGYGRMRGIQGHHNSCYLDATLFSMFSFTSVFDSLLHRRKDQEDLDEYEQVQMVLKDNIVNPLRRYSLLVFGCNTSTLLILDLR